MPEPVISLPTGDLPTPPQNGCEDCHAEEVVGGGSEIAQTTNSLREFEKEVAGPRRHAFLFDVAAEEAEDKQADVRICCVAESNDCGDSGGHLPITAAIERRQQHQRIKLEQ